MYNELPLDIVDRIFTSFSDFESLWTAVRVSKRSYNVFKLRSTSILHAISVNIAGRNVMHVLRLVQTATNLATSDSEGVKAVPAWEDVPRYPVTTQQRRLLIKSADVLQGWELFLSRRHKDCTVPTVALTDAESDRFQQAMCEFWMYQQCFGEVWRECVSDDIPTDFEPQIVFLKRLSAEELQQFATVCLFMEDTSIWLCTAFGWDDANDFHDNMMSCSPEDLLRCVNVVQLHDFVTTQVHRLLPDIAGFDNTSYNHFVWCTLDKIGVDIARLSYNSLFQEATEENHTCARCEAPSGQNVWNESNWDLLYGAICPQDLPTLLPGRLQQNVSDGPFFRQRTSLPQLRYPVLMRQLFDEREADDNLSDQSWICTDCLRTLLRENLCSWWLHRKLELGLPIQQDCWWGWDCRTQTHSLHHASRLNHFCARTRGTDS